MSKSIRSSAPSLSLNPAEWGAVAVLVTFLVLWFGSAFT